MNLLKIACRHKSYKAEAETADLTVEEFAELRQMMDLCGIMTAKDDTAAEPQSDDAVTISVTTADGVHDHTFHGDAISSELEELTDFIKYLGKVHQIGFGGTSQSRVSNVA